MSTALEALLLKVSQSKKYKNLAPSVVQRVAQRELERSSSPDDALKRTKRRLHQIFGAYGAGSFPFRRWERRRPPASAGEEAQRLYLEDLLSQHASSRERQNVAAQFYEFLNKRMPPRAALLDVGCGLNPLAWPHMGLPPGLSYHYLEIDREQLNFVDTLLESAPHHSQAHFCDAWQAPALVEQYGIDTVWLFKILPNLDQQQDGAGTKLLEALAAPQIAVSYPTRSLGGRDKGMSQSYGQAFEAMATARSWSFERVEFPGELLYLLRK